MNNNLIKTEEKIRPIIETCKTANDTYLIYLQKYVKELIISDNERDTEKKKRDLGLQMGIMKLLKKDVSKEIKQFQALNKHKIYLIPIELDSINNNIKKILIKRGWA